MKIVALYDTHIPFNIKLDPIFDFILDFKPDTIILGGDMHDWTVASHWISNQSLQLEGTDIKKSYEELHSVLLNPLRAVIPPKSKIFYLTGNHEYWLSMCIDLDRRGRGYWEMKQNIDLKKFNMKILPFNIPYRVNSNLVYIHGTNLNDAHAKKTVQDYHTSVFYGHAHTIQSYVQVSPVDVNKFYKGQCVGCLCNLSPHFMQNRPNKWVHGFHYAHVDRKYFHDVQVVIVNEKFWANGKYYK